MQDLPGAGPQPLTGALWGVEKTPGLRSEGMAFSPRAAELTPVTLGQSPDSVW